jgi:transposase
MEVQSNGSVKKPRAARGRWSAQQRQEIVEASLVPGAVLAEVAQRLGVRVALISSWRRRLAQEAGRAKRSKPTPRFAAVRVDRVVCDGFIEIDLSNHCVRVRGVVDSAMLREVLAAIR